MPTEPEPLVVNTGPLIALGRVDSLDVIDQIPIKFVAPVKVADEIIRWAARFALALVE